MKKEHILAIAVPAAALVLAVLAALPILITSKALNVAKMAQVGGFFFCVFLCLGIIIFAHKMFSGKAIL